MQVGTSVAKPVKNQTNTIPIERLQNGQRGLITEIRGKADEIARLAELGIRTGTELLCVRRGCPCIVQFGGSRMCLRTAGHLTVMVSRI